MGQRSRASGNTVWFVYAHVFVVISHAYPHTYINANFDNLLKIEIASNKLKSTNKISFQENLT